MHVVPLPVRHMIIIRRERGAACRLTVGNTVPFEVLGAVLAVVAKREAVANSTAANLSIDFCDAAAHTACKKGPVSA